MQKLDTKLLKNIFKKYNLVVRKIKEVSTGKFNQTYIGIIRSNQSSWKIKDNRVVLRIAPPDDAGYVFYEKNMMAREPKIHKIVRKKTSIPIPEIYIYDSDRDIINRNFLLMEYISGQPMSDVKINEKNKKKIMELTGKYIQELHENCKDNKFGYPQNIGMEQTSNWVSAFETMWNKLIDDLKECKVYNSSEVDKAREALKLYIDLFDRDITASFLHMDIWSQNIMIDNKGNITGIVDWDRGVWGDPEIEFAVLDYCGFNNSDFWKGYGFKPEETKSRKIRKKFYHLYEVQKYPIIWTYRDPNPGRTDQYKKYSLDIINKLLDKKY